METNRIRLAITWCLREHCSHCLVDANYPRHTGLKIAIEHNDAGVQELLYRYGRDVAQQAIIFRETSEQGIEISKAWNIPVFPLKGDDFLQAGYETGPALGEAMNQAEQWWIEQGFQPDYEACKAYIKSIS